MCSDGGALTHPVCGAQTPNEKEAGFLSRRSKTRNKSVDLLAEVARLGAKGETGILTVDAGSWAICRLYLMSGEIIAANEDDTDARLESLLVDTGAVERPVLEQVRASGEGRDLGDLLIKGKHVSGADLMAARTQLFRDAFLWASAAASAGIEFEAQDAVFPDNMQFGIDRDALVVDARSWLEACRASVDLLQDESALVVATGARPEELSTDTWELLSQPTTGVALLQSIAASREAGMRLIASLLADGRLGPPGAIMELTELDTVQPLDPEDELELEAVEPDVEAPTAELPEDDYDRAARGDFIKSYEVLDKVDLSGVALLGTEQHDGHDNSTAIELGDEEEAVALGGADEDDRLDGDGFEDDGIDDVIAALDQERTPVTFETAPQLARLHQAQPPHAPPAGEDDFAMFDTGDPSDIEEDFDFEDESGLVELAEDDESELLVTGDQIDVSVEDAGPFGREELAGFHERIDIFNNIFRIIFRTFSEHIGPDNSLQRFNALLSSNQRQYPELFADILVADDGSVVPAPLINNLSNCTAGDYGSLLHQGLYELIFSHLYDAKDMLPGDVESGMMEQILVFERQLHQG